MNAVRAYRASLRLYPKAFRDEYGTDMVALLEDQLLHEPAWRVHCRAAADLAITIPNQHLELHMHQPSERTVTLVAVVGAVSALAIGSVIGTVAIPALVVLVVAMWVSLASRRAHHLGDSPRWWKRVVLGVALVAGVAVATSIPWPDSIDLGGDLAWSLGAITIIIAIALIGSGLLLGALGRRPARP